MKKFALIISAWAFASSLVIAQPPRHGGPPPEQLLQELQLSQQQQQQAMTILRQQHEKRRALHQQERNNRDVMRTQMRTQMRTHLRAQMDELHQQTLNQLSTVFSQSQLQQFIALSERGRPPQGRPQNRPQNQRVDRNNNAIQLASVAPRQSGNNAQPGDLPKIFEKFTDNVEIYRDGNNIVLSTDDIPNHPSPYFSRNDSRYTTPKAGMMVNPNRITGQNYTLRIPLNPQTASRPTDTNLDAIGIAVNGVVLFNQYAGRNRSGGFLPLEREIKTFDQYNGHPARQGNYHYHIEPVYLTAKDKTALVGVALDGFPIYGPLNPDGRQPSALDHCNGEFGPTPDHPQGIYHYHITAVAPYILGCYSGQPGFVTN